MHRNRINNKKYFGITSRKTSIRWGVDGKKYFTSPHFYAAIKKWGWDCFEHIIIAENFPEPCAKTYEKVLIKLFDTTNPDKGYNISAGGDGYTGSRPKPSVDTKAKMSESHKGMFVNGPCSKTIVQYSINGEFIKEWPSSMEIQRVLGYLNSNISRCCRGDRKTAYKFIWKYKEK